MILTNENNLTKNEINPQDPSLLHKKAKKSKLKILTLVNPNKFITDAVEVLKSSDDMATLTTLYELTSQLSMANDTLAEDPNCVLLIQQLILLFDKFFLPDITLYSLQGINHLLDLNPVFTYSIHKFGGINKIVLMTQNIEFIDLAENAIKTIEKISAENSSALIESDAFVSVLNLIDFFDNNLKRSALKACLNMTYAVNSYEIFMKYIIPGIPSLSALSKINDNDMTITALSVQCFFSLLTNFKNYFGAEFAKIESCVENSFIQYGMLENIYEITLMYINSDREKKINTDLFRNILKIYQILCSFSNSATCILLNMNILEIVYCLLRREIGNTDKEEYNENQSNNSLNNGINSISQTNLSNSSLNLGINISAGSANVNNRLIGHSFLNEIFSILMALFPKADVGATLNSIPSNTGEKQDNEVKIEINTSELKQKILLPTNKIFYDFFADKILKLLLSKILSISACSTLINIVKLLRVYLTFSDREHIISYIEADKLSNILAKLLDTKDIYYLEQIISLIEIIMKKAPEHFLEYIMREGIVENLKIFKFDKLENSAEISSEVYDSENLDENKKDKVIVVKQENIELVGNNQNNIKSNLNQLDPNEDLPVYSYNDEYVDDEGDYNEDEEENEDYQSEESPAIEDDYEAELERAIEMSKSMNETAKDKIEDEKPQETIPVECIVTGNGSPGESNLVDIGAINEEENLKIQTNSNKEIISTSTEKKRKSIKVFKDFKQGEVTSDNNSIKKELKEENDSKIAKEELNAYNGNTIINPITCSKNIKIEKTHSTNCKTSIVNPEIEMLHSLRNKLQNLLSTYFSKDKVEECMKSRNIEYEDPMNIFKNLEKFKLELNSIVDKSDKFTTDEELSNLIQVLKNIMAILLNKEKPLTFWEIEKSEILLAIANFFDKNFIQNLSEINEEVLDAPMISSLSKNANKVKADGQNKNLLVKNLDFIDNSKIIQKLKIFYSFGFKNDPELILNFIKILQHTITTMNCFTLYLVENNDFNPYTKNNFSRQFLRSYKDAKKYKIKFLYCEENISEMKTFLNKNKNKSLLEKVSIMNDYLSLRKEYVMTVSSEEKFHIFEKIIKEELPAASDRQKVKKTFKSSSLGEAAIEDSVNTEHLAEEEDDLIRNKLNIVFFIYIVDAINGGKQKFLVDKNWTTIDILSNLKKRYTKEEIAQFTTDLPIMFELNWENDVREEQEASAETIIKADSTGKSKIEEDIEINVDINVNPLQPIVIPAQNAPGINFHKNIFSELKKFRKNTSQKIDIINSQTEEGIFEIMTEKIFTKFYIENILSNERLYEIKRLAPSLYLLAVIDLSLSFGEIFNLSVDKSAEYQEHITAALENQKVSSLLMRQLSDPSAISYGSVPLWCKTLPESFTFISNFNSRYLLFKTCSFDLKRGTINLHNFMKNYSGDSSRENSIKNINISKSSRLKVIVERDEVIAYAMKLMKENPGYNGFVEFEYLNETGSGLGPTLEFYSLVISKLTENKNLWYRHSTNNKLYPAPVKKNSIASEENLQLFSLLGYIIARALYDDRLIDIPLSSLFWALILGKPINVTSLYDLDADLANTIHRDFSKIISSKNKFLSENLLNCSHYLDVENDDYDLGEKIKYNNTRIDELAIVFNLPGYPELELIPGGVETILTIHNIEEYVVEIYDKLFGSGVKAVISAFKSGFNLVFSIENLKCFHPKEIEESLCGSMEMIWDYETLFQNVWPDHGYDRQSRIYTFLLTYMSELDKKSKRNFLAFVTGSTRLPHGGFKNLSPRLTVVKAVSNNPMQKIDNILPTVMTCQNYLKVPEYSSYEIFKERLSTAMKEGLNAFLLS